MPFNPVFTKEKVGDHVHDGIENYKVEFGNLNNRKHVISHTIYGTAATVAANYGHFWIAPWPCFVERISEVHSSAGTDGGSVTLNIEKLTDGVSIGSGTAILSTAFNLKATANTTQEGTLTATLVDRRLSTGNRLAMKSSGTLTSVANVTIMVEVRY